MYVWMIWKTCKLWNLYFALHILPPPLSLSLSLASFVYFLFYLPVAFCQVQGIINFTSTYDSRTQEVEGSVAARGDLWRVEASRGGSTSGNENSSLFLVQLGPLLFIRDSTLLLPVHLSKQHLLWYGYDRKVNTRFSLPKCISL